MNRINYLTGIFHTTIITISLLSLSGCGYKKDPYYMEEAPVKDKDVKFTIKKSHNDNSTNKEK